jgi:peptidoglycan/LPS O-acetylase OafA/YrhL
LEKARVNLILTKLSSSREVGIDLARTLAILGVIVVHAGGFDFGRRGVQLFFLVSGYLLAYPVEKEEFRTFLFRRAMRLFPLYYIFLFLFFVSSYPNLYQFIFSLTLLQGLHWLAITGPGVWSISNEWIFSLALGYLRALNRKSMIIWIIFSWLLQFISSYYIYSIGGVPRNITTQHQMYFEWINTLNPLVNLVFFLIGIGLKKRYLQIFNLRTSLFVVASGVTFVEVLNHEFLFLWPIILWAVFSICLGIQKKGMLFSTIVQFIGQRTYGIFFIHFIFVQKIRKFCISSLQIHNSFLLPFITCILTLLVALPVSDISWRVIEKPFIKLARKVNP